MNRFLKNLSFVWILVSFAAHGQKIIVPKIYSNIISDESGIYLNMNGRKIYASPAVGMYTLSNFETIKGTPQGLQFNFKAPKTIRKYAET